MFVCLCCCFTSQQQIRVYQDGYRLLTVHTHIGITVLPHWDTRPLTGTTARYPTVTLSEYCANQSLFILLMPSTSLWFDLAGIRTPDFPHGGSLRSIDSAMASGLVLNVLIRPRCVRGIRYLSNTSWACAACPVRGEGWVSFNIPLTLTPPTS